MPAGASGWHVGCRRLPHARLRGSAKPRDSTHRDTFGFILWFAVIGVALVGITLVLLLQ